MKSQNFLILLPQSSIIHISFMPGKVVFSSFWTFKKNVLNLLAHQKTLRIYYILCFSIFLLWPLYTFFHFYTHETFFFKSSTTLSVWHSIYFLFQGLRLCRRTWLFFNVPSTLKWWYLQNFRTTSCVKAGLRNF